MKKKTQLISVYIIASVIFTFLTIISGKLFNKAFSISVGQIAPSTIYAPFQIENEWETNRLREEAEKNVGISYKVDEEVEKEATQDIALLFDYIKEAKARVENSKETTTKPANETNYEADAVKFLQNKSPIVLYKDEYETLLTTSEESLNRMEEICLDTINKLYEKGVKLEDTNEGAKIRNLIEDAELTLLQQKIAAEIVSAVFKPNVVIDEEGTEIAKEAAKERVEPIIILKDEKIIEQGTRVTEETYALLESLGLLSGEYKVQYLKYIGIGCLIIFIIVLGLRYIKTMKKEEFIQMRSINLIFILYMLSLLIIKILGAIELYIYIPITLAPMLVAILMRTDLAIIFQILLVVMLSLFNKGGMEFTLYFILTGFASIFIVTSMQERKQTFKSAIVVGAAHLAVYVILQLIIGVSINFKLCLEGIEAFLVGFLMVILVVGSLPLWEAIFGFITPVQLLELTNPNQPILKRLLIEATGTYYHSLVVANLAESAADQVGANALMTRVGGYYHDIGKIENPQYFKENQSLENPHDHLEPKASTNIILSHVADGIHLANQYKLPKCIKDIIAQHHGTGLVQYFYVKYTAIEGNSKDEAPFRYRGPKPQTKEAALVMLADIVEASVRAVQHRLGIDFTIEEFVRKMVRQKLDQGELDECNLYISDIEKIIQAFTKVLTSMYHERIEYPEKNK